MMRRVAGLVFVLTLGVPAIGLDVIRFIVAGPPKRLAIGWVYDIADRLAGLDTTGER